MNFDVYCDESGPELLHSEKPKARFMVIGSLWLPEGLRVESKAALHELRHRHGIGSEFKWRKVSPSKLAFYREAVSWFMEAGQDQGHVFPAPGGTGGVDRGGLAGCRCGSFSGLGPAFEDLRQNTASDPGVRELRGRDCPHWGDLGPIHHRLRGGHPEHPGKTQDLTQMDAMKAKKYRRFDQAGSAGAFVGSAAAGREQEENRSAGEKLKS